MRYHFTPVRMTIINKSTNSKCWRGCGETGTLVHCWWECRLMQPLWNTVWNFLKKLKMDLPFNPAIQLLGLYAKNPESPIQKNLCTPMFIAIQFTIAKCCQQPISKWVDQKPMVHLHSGILHSRKKERTPTLHNGMDGTREHYAKWNKPGSERQIPYDLIYTWNLINKTYEQNRTRDLDIKTKLTVTREQDGGG